MGFFGRVGNLLSGYISTRTGSSPEETLKEQALEAELKKPSPSVKAAARDRLTNIKESKSYPVESADSSDGEGRDNADKSPPEPKKRTL